MTIRTVSNGEVTERALTSEEQAAADANTAAEAPTLAGAIAAKKAEVDALYIVKITAPFTHGGNVFDADKGAQDSILAAISYGQLNAIDGAVSRTWTLANNSAPAITWGVLRAMAAALFERADAHHGYARTHKDAIDVLANVAAVDAYDIIAGWGV